MLVKSQKRLESLESYLEMFGCYPALSDQLMTNGLTECRLCTYIACFKEEIVSIRKDKKEKLYLPYLESGTRNANRLEVAYFSFLV